MAEGYTLMKSQKNEVFKILQDAGLEPANFAWKIGRADVSRRFIDVPRLEYHDGQYYFQFEPKSCTLSPGELTAFAQYEAINWPMQIDNLIEWTDNLKREIEAPDLWAEMEKYKTSVSLALPEQILNEPIPAYEAEEIAKKLEQLANKIQEQFNLTNEQNKFVRRKLNYLAEAAKSQRSVNFVYMVIGVFVTIATALTLAPDQAKELWELIKSIMGGVIHLIGP